jgi:hypothetical protein
MTTTPNHATLTPSDFIFNRDFLILPPFARSVVRVISGIFLIVGVGQQLRFVFLHI